jgi:hypothetical protein
MTGTFISSIDYVFQLHVMSGAHFGFKYQPGTFVYCLDESTSIFAPKFLLDSQVLVHTRSPPHVAKVHIYAVLFKDGSLVEYSESDNLF